MPQRTWRSWIKNITPLEATRNSILLCKARDQNRPSHSTGTSSQGHFRSDLKHNKWTPDAPSGRSQVQRTGTSAIARSLHSTLDTTTNASWLLWRRFLVTHIELSWYQRSLPINHYYHRHLIGLALCYCRFVHLYCYIRTTCRGPEPSVLNSPLERVNLGAHRSMHISRNLIRTNLTYWCTNDEANESTANERTNNCPNECVTESTNGIAITNISIIKTPRTTQSKRTIQISYQLHHIHPDPIRHFRMLIVLLRIPQCRIQRLNVRRNSRPTTLLPYSTSIWQLPLLQTP